MIFRYNPNGQEAVVPLESRNAGAYVLAFDNTNQTATGVAINSVSAQAVNIPVVVRDASGAQIASDTLRWRPTGTWRSRSGATNIPRLRVSAARSSLTRRPVRRSAHWASAFRWRIRLRHCPHWQNRPFGWCRRGRSALL